MFGSHIASQVEIIDELERGGHSTLLALNLLHFGRHLHD